VADYRIYYGDGGPPYEGPPEQAPAQNVQAIAWNDPDKGTGELGRIVLREWDIYIFSDHVGDWHGTNKFSDLMQHLAHGCGPGGVRAVLQGSWINRTDFLQILDRARTDPGLNRKSSNHALREDGRE